MQEFKVATISDTFTVQSECCGRVSHVSRANCRTAVDAVIAAMDAASCCGGWDDMSDAEKREHANAHTWCAFDGVL